jgi:kinesin family protein 5/centromeric protein E
VVNIGPAMKHAEETLSSLSFGMRAMKVQNMPIVNLIGGGNIKEQLGEESKQEVITRLQSS